METTTSVKAKTIAELLPGLSGILSKDAIHTLTAKKQPRTAEKAVKPLTMAEMRTAIMSLNGHSVKKTAPVVASNKKKTWNSSIKLDRKTISHTANGQLNHNPAKKMLNFQTKPKVVSNLAAAMVTESPKFPKPEFRVKKSLALQAHNNVRISGINYIPETPTTTRPIAKSIKNRMTLANKENISKPTIKISSTKKIATPKSQKRKNPQQKTQKPIIRVVPDTPLSNISWKSSCDSSFLQKEKEINDFEEKTEAIVNERTLDNISKLTPPISTPFKEYRNMQEYFNNSNSLENSAIYNDNTIMCFDKPGDCKDVNKREDSVIVSLCDLLNKATVNTDKMGTELCDLVQIEKQTEHNIQMITKSICALNNIKESHLKTLQYIRKLIREKRGQENHNKTLTETKDLRSVVKTEAISPENSPISKTCSVIKSCSKSPSYKVPKKNLCLRKKVFHKSMPNVSSNMGTPIRSDMGNRALSVYMKMKEHMNFLNTPIAKPRQAAIPDTPGVTSHNLQKQLDKLYGEQ